MALLTSLAGITALVVALSAHGQRETLTTGRIPARWRLRDRPPSASASLRYYVATRSACSWGRRGWPCPTRRAGRLRRHWVGTAIGLNLVITGLRRAREGGSADELDESGQDHLAGAGVGAFFLPTRATRKGFGPSGLAHGLRARVTRRGRAPLIVAASRGELEIALRPQPGHGRLVLGRHAGSRPAASANPVSRRAAPAHVLGAPTPWSRASWGRPAAAVLSARRGTPIGVMSAEHRPAHIAPRPGFGGYRTRQVVAPTPVPQRSLPSWCRQPCLQSSSENTHRILALGAAEPRQDQQHQQQQGVSPHRHAPSKASQHLGDSTKPPLRSGSKPLWARELTAFAGVLHCVFAAMTTAEDLKSTLNLPRTDFR